MATEMLLPVRPVSLGLHERCLVPAESAGADSRPGNAAKVLYFPFEAESGGCIRGWMVAAGLQAALLGAAFLAWEIWRFVR